MAEPLKQGQVLGLEALAGGPSADRSLEMLAEKGLLTVFAGESWRSFSREQWDALHKAGARLLAGDQGRKVLALADGTMALFDLAADVEACHPEFPGLDAMTDADWANVDRVLRALPGSWPLLRGLWDAAGKELSGGQ